MEHDFDLHLMNRSKNGKSGRTRGKGMKRYIAVLLSAILAASTCLPAMAAEQPAVQTEEAGAASTENEQAEEEAAAEPAVEEPEAEETAEEETAVEETSEEAAPEENEEAGEESGQDDAAVEQQEEAEELNDAGDADTSEAAAEETEDAVIEEETVDPQAVEKDKLMGVDDATGETSSWLIDYDYEINEYYEGGYDTEDLAVILLSYNGADTTLTVPGTAMVNGVEYPVSAYSANNVWSSVEDLTFGSGFCFYYDCNSYFSNMNSLIAVDMSQANTSYVQHMDSMFAYCNNLQSVNMTGIDVSNVETTNSMFSGCSSLEEIDLSCFSGNMAGDVSYMFEGCDSLLSVNLSGWDFSNLEYGDSLFYGCDNLEELVTPVNVQCEYVALPCQMVDENGDFYQYLPAYNSSSLTLTKVEVPAWLAEYDYSVNSSDMMVELQYYNGSDTEIVVPGSVTLGGQEYQVVCGDNCPWHNGITSLSFEEGFALTEAYTWRYFNGMSDLETLDLRNVSFPADYDDEYAIQDCKRLQTLYLPAGFNIILVLPKVLKDDNGNWYERTPTGLSYSVTLQPLEVSPWLENYNFSIDDDYSTITLDDYIGSESEIVVESSAVVEGTEYSNIEVGYEVWGNCDATSITFENGVQFSDCNYLFSDMRNLTSVDFSALGTVTPTSCYGMFWECESLTEVDLSMFDLSDCWSPDGMFDGCSSLETIQTPVNCSESIALPGAFADEEGNIYTSVPAGLTESITLTKVEQSEWLNDYDYEINGDVIYLTHCLKHCDYSYDEETGEEYYNGTITVPGSATVGTTEFNKIVIAENVWDDSGVTELIFQQGVALPSDSDNMFEDLNLTAIDLSAVDVTDAESMNNMFRGCTSLSEIKTPVNVTLDAALPAAYVDENGNVYSYLPNNLTESVTLTRATQSEWLDDYEYRIDGNKIVLTAYHGDGENVTVYGSAEVAGTTYSQVEYTSRIDAGDFYGTLTFEQGVVFPDDCTDLFENAWSLTGIDFTNIDTTNVTNMSYMFNGCSSLTELDLSGFDTSNVTDMSYMFNDCSTLTELDYNGTVKLDHR